MSDFDLGGYTPEKPTEGFEMMKGKGNICKVNSSMVEAVEAGINERTGESYEAYDKLRYELEVVSEKYKSRKIWKSYNLDSQIATGKKNKTPIMKLADAFFGIGLTFKNRTELETANEKFVAMNLIVSFRSWTPPGADEAMQLHVITGIAPDSWDEEKSEPVATKF